MKSIIFKLSLLITRYKYPVRYFIMGTLLYVPNILYAHPTHHLFIGTNATGGLGYLHIKTVPINRLYTVLEIKDTHCGGYIKGFTEQQGNRFILHTDVPDPREDEAHQCQVTFIQKDQKLQIIKEENCTEWHNIGCSFTSLQFFPAPNPLSSQQK